MAKEVQTYSRGMSHHFWHNLLLLGFNPVEAAKISGNKTTFHENMFEGNTSNEPGLLEIVHFLLRIFFGNSEKFKKEFASCYPIHDNAQRREFKAKVRKLISDLEKKKELPFGFVRGSTLNTAKGKPAQSLIWILSHIVMRKEIEKTRQSRAGRLQQEKPPKSCKEESFLPLEELIPACSSDVCVELEKLAQAEEMLLKERMISIENEKQTLEEFQSELSTNTMKLKEELLELEKEIEEEKTLARQRPDLNTEPILEIKNDLMSIADPFAFQADKIEQLCIGKLFDLGENTGTEIVQVLDKWNKDMPQIEQLVQLGNLCLGEINAEDLSKEFGDFQKQAEELALRYKSCVRLTNQFKTDLAKSPLTVLL